MRFIASSLHQKQITGVPETNISPQGSGKF